MHDDTITRLPDPSGIAPDALTEGIGAGARKLIERAIEAALVTLLAAFSAHGANARRLSATTITRLKADWWHDDETWQKRDLGPRRFLDI